MLQRLFHSQLRINMASGVITAVINTVVLAIGYPIYLHFLGYEQYGLWLVLSVVLTVAQLGSLGIGPAVTKLVAEDYGRGDVEGIHHYVTTALALLCLSGSLVLILMLLFESSIVAAFKLTDANAQIAISLIPYIGILSVYVFAVQVPNAVLSGLGRMDLANYIQTASRIVGVTAATVLLYKGIGVAGLLIGNALSHLVTHVLSLVYIRRITKLRALRLENLDWTRCKRLLCIGGNVFGASLISMLFNPFNKLMLSRYAGVASVPVYEIAFTGSMQVRSLIDSGLRAIIPEVSRIGAEMTGKAKDRISQVYRHSMRLVFLAGIPIYAGVTILAPLLLKRWLGDSFVETLPGAFRIMLIGTSFTSLVGGLPYYVIMGCGKVRRLIVSNLIAAGCNCLLVVAYGSISGHLSAHSIGWCMAASCVVSTAYLVNEVRRLLAHEHCAESRARRLDEEHPWEMESSGGLPPSENEFMPIHRLSDRPSVKVQRPRHAAFDQDG